MGSTRTLCPGFCRGPAGLDAVGGECPATHAKAIKQKQRSKSSGAEAQPGTALGIRGTEEMGDRLPLRKADGNSQECPYVVQKVSDATLIMPTLVTTAGVDHAPRTTV